ncbi:hypothetical protein MMC31_007221, partial [Peltigera leucophlebia]|nr:hypothetical protein [Peltigera leucophlebia]
MPGLGPSLNEGEIILAPQPRPQIENRRDDRYPSAYPYGEEDPSTSLSGNRGVGLVGWVAESE